VKKVHANNPPSFHCAGHSAFSGIILYTFTIIKSLPFPSIHYSQLRENILILFTLHMGLLPRAMYACSKRQTNNASGLPLLLGAVSSKRKIIIMYKMK
jgi:hypothetical protein